MDGFGKVGRLEVGVPQGNGAADVGEWRRLINVDQREQPVALHGEVVIGGAIALQALEGSRDDVECVRKRKQVLKHCATAVVELITLPGEAHVGEQGIASAEVDLCGFENERYGLGREQRRCLGRGLGWRLHGEAQVGKRLLHVVAAQQKIAGEQCATGNGAQAGEGMRAFMEKRPADFKGR